MASLNDEQIKGLLKLDVNRGEMQGKVKWPLEAHLEKIAKAVKRNETSVVVKGRKFLLSKDDKRNEIIIKPAEGFVPCGRIDMEVLAKL